MILCAEIQTAPLIERFSRRRSQKHNARQQIFAQEMGRELEVTIVADQVDACETAGVLWVDGSFIQAG